MSSLVFLLEEASARNMLAGIVPKLVPSGTAVRYILFDGKQDLEKQMVRKIRLWCEPDSRFIILRDKDAGNCVCIKQRLLDLAAQSGRGKACLVRIACHELESFFLGDLEAVAKALQLPALADKQRKKTYRIPDNIANAKEELFKITNGKYHKLAGARAIAPHLNLEDKNLSHSFRVLCEGIRKQVALLQGRT